MQLASLLLFNTAESIEFLEKLHFFRSNFHTFFHLTLKEERRLRGLRNSWIILIMMTLVKLENQNDEKKNDENKQKKKSDHIQ